MAGRGNHLAMHGRESPTLIAQVPSQARLINRCGVSRCRVASRLGERFSKYLVNKGHLRKSGEQKPFGSFWEFETVGRRVHSFRTGMFHCTGYQLE